MYSCARNKEERDSKYLEHCVWYLTCTSRSSRPPQCEEVHQNLAMRRSRCDAQDDDGTAYIAYSSEDNRVMHIGPLTRDFTNVEVGLAVVIHLGSKPLVGCVMRTWHGIGVIANTMGCSLEQCSQCSAVNKDWPCASRQCTRGRWWG